MTTETAIATTEPPPKDYNSPEHYRCGECGVTGVRLWREYNTFLDYQHLYCRACATKAQNKTAEDIEESIRYGRCDQIGWLVPALAGDDYDRIVAEACDGEEGPGTYEWDTGIAP